MSKGLVFYDEEGKEYNVQDVTQSIKERDTLASAIAEAALKAGIYNGEVQATGPYLLMFLDDMADYIKHLENGLVGLVKYNKEVERNVLELKRVNEEQRNQEKRLDTALSRVKLYPKRDKEIEQIIKNIRSAKSLAYRDAQLEQLVKVWENA